MFKVMTFLMVTDSRNYNLEHRFTIMLDNFSPLSNNSPFCYTPKVRVRMHSYFGANCELMEISHAK